MKPVYFKSPAEFRKWLAAHHGTAKEILVGFHKKGTGVPSLTWPESVDEALCFGWIDGVRKRVDEDRYTIRFTPRRKTSIWSRINIGRVRVLAGQGRMTPAGTKAFEARDEKRTERYAYENRPQALAAPYEKKLRGNRAAWTFFQAQPPSYVKLAAFYVMSAKQEETRLRRQATVALATQPPWKSRGPGSRGSTDRDRTMWIRTHIWMWI